MSTSSKSGPAAGQNREEDDATGKPAQFNQTKLGVATVVIALSVLVVFLANMAYLFGSTFQQTQRNHSFTIAAVSYDTDDSIVWNAFMQAYDWLRSGSFPSLVVVPSSSYSDPTQLVTAVREQEYWGALYIHPGASSRLAAAVAGQSQSYNASDAVTYIWNEIRYPSVAASVIQAGILRLQATAEKVFQAGAAQQLLYDTNTSFPQTAVTSYLAPFTATGINVSPAPQAEKAFYDTVVMAMSIIQQNVFLIAFTGVSRASGLFSRPFKTSATWALLVGLVYTLFGSLMTTGYMWAFREDWAVTGAQFCITWMALWLVQHIYYQLLDGTLALLPIQFFSFLLVTFVFLNVAATVFPLEAAPGFFVWSHALPGYQVLQLLLNVWTRGSHKLDEALAVLFAWWVVSGSYAAVGTLKKSQAARKQGGSAVGVPAI